MLPLRYQDGLIPVVVQDHRTGEVLMVAFANDEAVELTVKTAYSHFYSRSRKKIWKKGEESGHYQHVTRILVDCDEDCLLYEVEQEGGACHTGHKTCFYRTIDGEEISEKVFDPTKVYANKDQ
jgi:phosphoribosyl-AMP cyclohydrolase